MLIKSYMSSLFMPHYDFRQLWIYRLLIYKRFSNYG